MGAADVVPGVSGGTIAFISGVYGQLLLALSSLPGAALLLFKGQLKAAWTHAQANFLLVLFGGILTSILSFARLISWLLEHQPIAIWSFFFGLVLISCFYVARDIRRWNWSRWLAFAVGTLLAWYITVAAPVNWGHDLPSIFLAGAIAICAMLLPGVSGSFLLLLMGLYGYILSAVKNLELGIIVVFALGCACGLLLFARLLKLLLDSFRDVTLALLTGFMLGSLNKVWPWRQTIEWAQKPGGEQIAMRQEKLWPWEYLSSTGDEPQLLLAIALAVAAAVLVFALERFARRMPNKVD